jgi:hypothetical protein
MLDTHFTTRCTGDATTGFYVPDPNAPISAAHTGDRPRSLEGYSWRGMTSGSPLQALWVLLAPFALANTAAAMRPPASDRRRSRVVRSLHACGSRLFALSLTLTLLMAAYVAAIDETAWQCGNAPACVSAHTPAKYLNWGGLAGSPPRRIAVTLLVPLATILLLWYLARRAWKARAAVLSIVATHREPIEHARDPTDVDNPTDLDDPTLWEDREPSEYLRHLHIAAALSMLSAMTSIGLGYTTAGTATGLRGVAVAAVAVGTLAVFATAVGWNGRAKRVRRVVSAGLLITAGAVLIGLLAALLANPAVHATRTTALPGVETAILILFIAQIVLMILLCVLGTMLHRDNRAYHVGLLGAGSAFVSGIALVVGAMFSAGLVLRVAGYLGQPTTTVASAHTPARVKIIVPNTLTWAARGAFLLAVIYGVALIVIAVGWLLVMLIDRSRNVLVSLSRFVRGVPAPDPLSVERLQRERQVQRAERLAGLTDHAGPILAVPSTVAAAVAVALTFVVVRLDTHHYLPTFEMHGHWIADHATTYGSWIITAFTGLLLATVLRARSSEHLRRSVGILWDLTTFWPRHAHPLAPPCYTDRALPEFAYRTRWHVQEGRDVIVSAHSQGTIIAATVLLQLHQPERDHVAFLTYGSPLQRLYAPWFPSFFNAAAFVELDRRVSGRWTNLYRTTDPIGGPISPRSPAGPTNMRITPVVGTTAGDIAYPEIRVHSDYQAEPEYADAISQLDQQL